MSGPCLTVTGSRTVAGLVCSAEDRFRAADCAAAGKVAVKDRVSWPGADVGAAAVGGIPCAAGAAAGAVGGPVQATLIKSRADPARRLVMYP